MQFSPWKFETLEFYVLMQLFREPH